MRIKYPVRLRVYIVLRYNSDQVSDMTGRPPYKSTVEREGTVVSRRRSNCSEQSDPVGARFTARPAERESYIIDN